MKQVNLYFTIFCLLVLSLSACMTEVAEENASTSNEVAFDFTLASMRSQILPTSSSPSMSGFTADDVMLGQLRVLNLDTAIEQVFDWSIYLNDDSWEVQSNKTIVLPPANYQFSLLLEQGSQQYSGVIIQEVIDGQNTIAMEIKPIIGDTVTDVSIVAELADFKFQYNPNELSAAGLTDPQIGIVVDDTTEEVFALNPSTGISDAYINIEEGSHQIQLKLYDGSFQKGRSVKAQESVYVSPGQDIGIDLVTLHGETVFSLTENGGEASFQFQIPREIIEEANGVANLEVIFGISGPKNPLTEYVLTLTKDASNDFQAQITLDNFQFDEVSLSLTFNDIISPTEREQLGICHQTTVIDSTERSISCGITLRRRAVISGSLLSVLYLNVKDELNQPVAGAVISADGDVVGVTGSGDFGSQGYLKTYLNSGTYIVRAENESKYGEIEVVLDSFEYPEGVEIVLDKNRVIEVPLVTSAWEVSPYDQPQDISLTEVSEGLRLSIHARSGGSIRTFDQYNMVNSDLLIKRRLSSASGYGCSISGINGVLNVLDSVGRTYHGCGSYEVGQNATYFYRVRILEDKSYSINVATGTYDLEGGSVVRNLSGTLSDEAYLNAQNASVNFVIHDFHSRSGSMVIEEIKIVPVN